MAVTLVPIEDLIIPRCTAACPAGVDVPRYIRAVRDQDYNKAVAILREKLPLPTVCADACFAPCEDMCAYKQFGEPVAIRAIKRAAMDKGSDGWKEKKRTVKKTGKKAAVVGAGPGGLTTAYYLATKGHDVTIFDTFPKPGGMMRYGIPDYRLPEDRLEKDINDILELGIAFKGDTVIGKDVTLSQLRDDFDAVFIGIGASASAKISIEGIENKGVLWGWDYLKDVGLKVDFDFSGNVVVVGGGNVAIDVALTAKRRGADKVDLFCLEKRGEMPAHEWEIARTEEEGIGIHNSWGPKRVVGNGVASGIIFKRCLSVFNDAGSFNPVFDEETTHKANGGTIIMAVGQMSDLTALQGEPNIMSEGIGKEGRIQVASEDLSTGEKGIFAGGDVVTGPDSIINAIAMGRKAARSMDRYLGGDGCIDEILAVPETVVKLTECMREVQSRNEMPFLKPWQRTKGFDQVELGLADEAIRAEANRCLDCDARKFEVVLNTENCKECGYCADVCKVGTFGPAEFFNVKGYRPYEVKSSDFCVGCFICFFSCPDFAIDVTEANG